MDPALRNILLSVVFAILGFVLLFGGYRIFDMLTPADLRQKIFEEGNLAAAVFTGAFVIAMALVVSAAIS